MSSLPSQSIFRQTVDFFLFTSVFIALCAVCMVLQTCYLFGIEPAEGFIPFVFFGSLCSYNFHWYLTPSIYGGSYKTDWSIRHKDIHLAFFGLGLIGAAWYITYLFHQWEWLIATAFITFLYSAPKIPYPPFRQLKHIAVGKTIFLSAVWMHSTVVLPLVMRDVNWTAAHFIFVINRFFFIYAICIVFDYRDRIEDKKEGIKSLITYLNERGINILFWTSIIIALCTNGWLLQFFSYRDAIALLVPIVITAFLYKYSKNNPSDYLYYFVLDGLMMFSSVFLFIFHF